MILGERGERVTTIEDIRSFRAHVPAAQRCAYFETAATGLVPDFVHDAVARYQEERYLVGGDSSWSYGETLLDTPAMLERSRQALARMLGATAEDIFFGQNTSQVYSVFTANLALAPGDNVVLPAGGWMANRFAWQARERDGVEIRYAAARQGGVHLAEVAALCDAHTRAVCLTLVEPETGFLLDAAAIGAFCRERGIWFVVDATQAVGVCPVDVQAMHIDFLAANDYKWMMNYCGTGFGYVSPALRAALVPRAAGWMSDAVRWDTGKTDLELRTDAGRYELGYPNVCGIYGLGLVAEQYSAFGAETVRGYVMALGERLKSGLSDIEGARFYYDFSSRERSAIFWIALASADALTTDALAAQGVRLTVHSRRTGEKRLRVAIHYYNNEADIDALLGALS